MDSVYATKILSMFSLVFSVLTFVLYYLDIQSTLPTMFIYAWACVIVSLIVILRRRNFRFAIVLTPLIFIPIVCAKTVLEVGFMVIIGLYGCLIIMKGVNLEYKNSNAAFTKLIILLILTYMTSLCIYGIDVIKYGNPYDEQLQKCLSYKGPIFGAIDKYSGLFFAICFISTIIVLRTLRYLDNNGDKKTLRRINISSGILTGILLILSMTYKKIGWAVINFFNAILHYNLGIGEIHYPKIHSGNGGSGGFETPPHLKFHRKLVPIDINLGLIIKVVVIVIVILVLIYIAIRILSKKPVPYVSRDGEECDEDIEKIKKNKKDKNNLLSNISGLLKHKNYNERIKICYERYMKLCVGNKIEIKKSDTSLDINSKSQDICNKTITERLREIYIKVKYSNFSADKNTYYEVREMINTINNSIDNK